jgi:uncharacterized membrane protein
VFDQLAVVNLILASASIALALWLRPWMQLRAEGPPWPWLALAALLPLLWGLDQYGTPLAQKLSGAPLLVLFAGWPLAMLALAPAALVIWLLADLSWIESLHRLVWLGVVPATLTLLIGALVRHYLPRHLFIYIFGRGFVGAFIACVLAGGADLMLHSALLGSLPDDLMIARVLSAFAESFLTGLCVAISVAYRPHWLATYSDRLYLPVKR